jgi:hypothetical protein
MKPATMRWARVVIELLQVALVMGFIVVLCLAWMALAP